MSGFSYGVAAPFRQWLSFPDIGRYRSSWPFEGDFTNLNSKPFVASTRTEASCLLHKLILEVFGDCVAIHFLCFLGTGFLAVPSASRLHGVDVYFEHSGRRSPPNMPCRFSVSCPKSNKGGDCNCWGSLHASLLYTALQAYRTGSAV